MLHALLIQCSDAIFVTKTNRKKGGGWGWEEWFFVFCFVFLLKWTYHKMKSMDAIHALISPMDGSRKFRLSPIKVMTSFWHSFIFFLSFFFSPFFFSSSFSFCCCTSIIVFICLCCRREVHNALEKNRLVLTLLIFCSFFFFFIKFFWTFVFELQFHFSQLCEHKWNSFYKTIQKSSRDVLFLKGWSLHRGSCTWKLCEGEVLMEQSLKRGGLSSGWPLVTVSAESMQKRKRKKGTKK